MNSLGDDVRNGRKTNELTPIHIEPPMDDTEDIHERETLPEVPLKKMASFLGNEDSSVAEQQAVKKESVQNTEVKTEPEVFIKINREQIIWVETDEVENASDTESQKIPG